MCILKGSEFRGRMFFLGAWALVLCPRVDDFHTHRLMAGPLTESGLLDGPAYFPGGNAQHSPGTWGHRWVWGGPSVRLCCTCWRKTTRTWGVPGRRKGQHWQHGRQSTTLTKTPPEALGWSVYLFCLSECLVIVCESWAVMDEKTSSGTVITEGCVLFYLFLTGY